jgi:carboxylate-amine ligase
VASGSWARWKRVGAPYTVGVEEEVMLLEGADLSLAQRSDTIIGRLSPVLTQHALQETHAGVVELVGGVHPQVAGAVSELWGLRLRLALELRAMGARAACAGMHPLPPAKPTTISGAQRYQLIADTMRSLARREPTMALHVHVAVPDPNEATRVLVRIRDALPLLVALAANSPFSGGRDTGFASARTITFDGFPRTGPPRAYSSYDEYVTAIDALITSGAIPDSSFLWWDVRLKPSLGTVEVRVMDAQSTVVDVAPLVALVQSLARLETEEHVEHEPVSEEVLAENRFLAARDGLNARLIEPASGRLTPARMLLGRLTEECLPHAEALGCSAELEDINRLTAANGAIRQRSWVRAGMDLPSVLSSLSQQFTTAVEPTRGPA